MKYLCLGYYDPETFDALSEDDRQAIAAECRPHDVALYESGHLVSVASLAHREAVTLQPQGGETSITDGPYAETKEVVGSFFIIEADDLDEAVRVASMHPAAKLGEYYGFAVEVRPIELFMEPGESTDDR